MRLISAVLTVLLAALLTACGGSDPVTVSGDGWSAEFPGEVEEDTQEIPVPGSDPVTADSYVWEDASSALTVLVTPFPAEITDVVEPSTLLESTAQGSGGTLTPDSEFLDDGQFQGVPAVAFDIAQEGFTGSGLAFFDDTVLYQLLGITESDGAPESYTTLVESFSLGG